MTAHAPRQRGQGGPPEGAQAGSKTRSRFQRMAPGLVLAIIVLMTVVIATALIVRHDEPVIVEGPRTRAIQLDVRNGTGVPGLAQRVTSFLRSKGYDVVEIGNTDSLGLEKTQVLDRSGNLEAARSVARALGLDDAQVRVKIDRTLYLDVSVHLGDDLRSFQPSQ
jgi:hypothetical protein